jgi:hypothetical protein
MHSGLAIYPELAGILGSPETSSIGGRKVYEQLENKALSTASGVRKIPYRVPHLGLKRKQST